jgi:hypothetical protein
MCWHTAGLTQPHLSFTIGKLNLNYMDNNKLLKLFEKKYPEIIGCEIEYIKELPDKLMYILQIEPEQPFISSYLRTLSLKEINN